MHYAYQFSIIKDSVCKSWNIRCLIFWCLKAGIKHRVYARATDRYGIFWLNSSPEDEDLLKWDTRYIPSDQGIWMGFQPAGMRLVEMPVLVEHNFRRDSFHTGKRVTAVCWKVPPSSAPVRGWAGIGINLPITLQSTACHHSAKFFSQRNRQTTQFDPPWVDCQNHQLYVWSGFSEKS